MKTKYWRSFHQLNLDFFYLSPSLSISSMSLNIFMMSVITVSRSTWNSKNKKGVATNLFLFWCDRSPGMHVLKLGIEIPNLKQHNWSTELIWKFQVREYNYMWGRISTPTTPVRKRYQLDTYCLLNSNEHAFIYLF